MHKTDCRDDGSVADEVTNNTLLLDRIALELDTGVKPVGNWRSLAAKLGLQLSRINHFEMYSNQNPMAMLFSYLNDIQKNLRVQRLKEHLTSMGRNDALDVLEKFNVNGRFCCAVYYYQQARPAKTRGWQGVRS